MTLLFVALLTTIGLSGCGAPQYTYVADSSAKTYYKVPSGWHQISAKDLAAAIKQAGGPNSGIWSTAFDADSSPSYTHDNLVNISKPFVFAQVWTLPASASNQLSYNTMRDSWLPVTSTTRQTAAQEGYPGTNFTPLQDQTIATKQGVHGVREIFEYTFGGVTDTFDEEVLTNANQTVLYSLQVHCTQSCYLANQKNIDTVMASFTVGSPT